MEQLIAESLGKQGLGVVPVAGERPRPAGEYGPDRVFCQLLLAGEDPPLTQEGAARLAAAGHPVMRMVLRDRLDLAAEMMRWEMAVATAGMVLGVQPFDQPNVERAKKLARAAMAAGDGGGDAGATAEGAGREITVDEATAEAGARALADWLDAAAATDYIAMMAFLAPTPDVSRAAESLRRAVLARGPQATTFGWGPRFLHSTGQMHKGGPASIRALQIVDRPGEALPVPGQEHDFRQLIAAQAAGDLGALAEAERATLRLRIEGDTAVTLGALAEALAEA
jgi:transaldolase/glucose-6-phosphate isomerase